MPNIEDAIVVNITLDAAGSTTRDWGTAVIIGEKEIAVTNPGGSETRAYKTTVTINSVEYDLAPENVPVLCYSVLDVQKVMGNYADASDLSSVGSTVTRSAIDLFNQGVRAVYVMAVEAASASNIKDPLVSDYEACLPFLIPLATNKSISGVFFAHQTDVTKLVALKEFCDTYSLIFTATNTPTSTTYGDVSSVISTYISGNTNLVSKHGYFLAHADESTDTDIAACAMGLLMKNKPWITPYWKTIYGTITKYFTNSCITTLETNGINGVTIIGGENKCSNGLTTYGGTYKFIDIVRTEYFTGAAIKDALVTLRSGADKIPYTQAGINQVLGALIGAMDSCVRQGGIAEYMISVPSYEQTTTANREARILDNIRITARLVGDIQTFNIGLTLTI